MSIHITDLPLEATEIALILGLGIGFILQARDHNRRSTESQRKLDDASKELRHLRRVIDQILLVDRGYSSPGDDVFDEDPDEADTRNRK